jgi:5-oxoprolinase (ATP-hydrolysing)
MRHIRDNAEQAVRKMLRAAAERLGTSTFSATDHLDDGSPVRSFAPCLVAASDRRAQIQLEIRINRETGSAVFDFAGTGPELRGNLNAPISVVHSAVI